MFIRVIRLIWGIFLFALGIVLSIKANLGIAPWEALHQGLSNLTGFSFGVASMGVGLLILMVNYSMQEKIGIGTLINIFGIGLIIDLLFRINLIPTMDTLWSGCLMLMLSMFTIAVGSYYYIGAGYGTGPRDGLMVGLVKKTGLKIGLIRGLIETSALAAGFMLGSQVGLGTLILGLGIGPVVQLTFAILKFDVSQVTHHYIH